MRRVTRRGKTIVSKASRATSTISTIPKMTASILISSSYSFCLFETYHNTSGHCRAKDAARSAFGKQFHSSSEEANLRSASSFSTKKQYKAVSQRDHDPKEGYFSQHMRARRCSFRTWKQQA